MPSHGFAFETYFETRLSNLTAR